MVLEDLVYNPMTEGGFEGVALWTEPAMSQTAWIKAHGYFLRTLKVLDLVQPKKTAESHEK